MIRDSAGNLFGTTDQGGTTGHGVVYELNTTEAARQCCTASTGFADGGEPEAGVIQDSAGNLYYGTTTLSTAQRAKRAVFKLVLSCIN